MLLNLQSFDVDVRDNEAPHTTQTKRPNCSLRIQAAAKRMSCNHQGTDG
jgi:hypothetical protein